MVFIHSVFMYITEVYFSRGYSMSTAKHRSHKHFLLDAAKIKRAQKALRADTETEAIDRALDMVISEHERNRLTLEAHDRFAQSGIEIKDVYGALEK